MAGKKDKLEEAPKTPVEPTGPTAVRSYYTKEILEQISEMTPKQMENLMKDLPSTPHWIAILKYTSMRMPLLDMALRGTDPTKDPHKISWSQGAMAGLSDIEQYVIDLNTPKQSDKEEAADDESPPPRTAGVIIE